MLNIYVKEEKKILQRIGWSTKEIAFYLGVSDKAAEHKISALLKKYKVKNRVELLATTLRHKVINLEDVIIRER